MKKWLWLLPIAALLALAACAIPGNVYMSFNWSVTPTNWYSSDPNIDDPSITGETLYRLRDYLTLPGSYDFAYTHENPVTPESIYYGRSYTLTAHKGAGSPGEDSYFRMYLNAGDIPDFWRIQSLSAGSGTASPPTASSSAVQPVRAFDKNNYRFRQLGEYSQTQGGYTLTVRYGVWEPKK